MALVMALNEHYRLFRVNAAGHKQGKRLQRMLPQLRRLLLYRNGMKVCYGVNAAVFVLNVHPVAHRSYIISQGKCPSGLNCAEYNFAFLCFHDKMLPPLIVYLNAPVSGNGVNILVASAGKVHNNDLIL